MKKYSDIIIVNLFFLIAGVALYYFVDKKIEILAAVIATGISLTISIRQVKLDDDRMFHELFCSFNKKYDSKFNDTLNKIDKGYLEKKKYELSLEEILLIKDYLNLCSEEFLWYEEKRIPKKVWEAWEKGMLYYFNIEPINEIVIKEKSQERSYYGLFKKIGEKINGWQNE